MADIKWLEGNRIQIAPPKRTKKITGTRFAKRKCGKDYRIVVLKSVEVKRVIDYYESKNFI